MKANVIVFPGSNCDYDCYYAMKDIFKADVEYVWHKEASFRPCDIIILPGGFSYGDYLRCGAISRFSPVMKEVQKAAEKGVLVIGICNGFQILLESGLLPGAMLRNKTLSFICQDVYLKTVRTDTAFTNTIPQNKPLLVPIAHGEGNYYCDDATLKQLEDNRQIVFQYCSKEGVVSEAYNPNGSRNSIAGIMNKKGNVLGMMPHPERAAESMLSSTDGKYIFESMIHEVTKR